jgi:acetyl-CoA C-acetyltransferase
VGAWEHSGEQGDNLGRRVAVLLGWDQVPRATVNRGCASSLQTTRMAANAIRAGDGHTYVSARVESVSRYSAQMVAAQGAGEFRNPRFAGAQRRSALASANGTAWQDPRAAGQFSDLYLAMGETAENVAGLAGVSRDDQDELALLSQQRAAHSVASHISTAKSCRSN